MRKASLVCLLFVMGLMVVPAMVEAQAVVIKDDSCTFFGTDGSLFEAQGGVEDLNSIKVITPSQNCNKNVSCHTVIEPPGQAYVFDYDSRNYGTGFTCDVEFIYTDQNGIEQRDLLSTENWHQTITPKGNVSLTCHFKCEAGGPPV